MAKTPIYYHVAPRYTAGSPAQVDEATALRVANEELRAHAIALTGIYGEEARVKADADGLRGIVEERTERTDCWIVRDLMTNDTFIRPFPERPAQYRDNLQRMREEHKLRKKYKYLVLERQLSSTTPVE